MAVEQSMWRVNDVVAYDLMRELSSSVQAHLIENERHGDPTAHQDLLDLRRATLAVDGYDRAAIDANTQQLQHRDAELAKAAADGPDPSPLTPDQAEAIYRADVQPVIFDGSASQQEHPALLLLGGQPGAGKSRAARRLVAEHPSMVALTGDDLRIFHPDYRPLVIEQPEHAGPVLAEATRPWVRAALTNALQQRRSLLLEGTFGDPDLTLETATRFREAGFQTRIVAIASPRVLSVVSVASRYLRDRKTGSPARFTRLSAHDRGYNGTTRLMESLNASTPVDRVTIISRNGNILYDHSRGHSSAGFADAAMALEDGRHPSSWGMRSTVELLGELKQITRYAIDSGQLVPQTGELLVAAHDLALSDVVPNLSIDTNSAQARLLQQSLTEQLIAIRRAAKPVDPALDPGLGLETTASLASPAPPFA